MISVVRNVPVAELPEVSRQTLQRSPGPAFPRDSSFSLEGQKNSHRFWTAQDELDRRKAQKFTRRSSVGSKLDSFLSSRHRRRFKKASWHQSPQLPFADWKRDFLPRLTNALVIPNALGSALDPVVMSRTEHRDFTEEIIEITLTPPLRAQVIVTIPKNGRKKHPALILLHSLGSLTLYGKEKLLRRSDEPDYLTAYRNQLYEGKSLLAEYARSGYLCIAIDALGFGNRTLSADEDLTAFEKLRRELNHEEAETVSLDLYLRQNELWARALGVVGLSIAAIVATDDLRAVDYLLSRSDVDASRIACVGLSFGSFRCNYLAALDDRIHAAASICWISTLDGIIDYNIRHSMGFFSIPGNLYADFDLVDIPIAAAPKPFLAISGWQDPLMEPRGTATAHLALRQAWQAAGNPDALGSLIYDAPHEFNSAMQDTVLSFLDLHLQIPRTA